MSKGKLRNRIAYEAARIMYFREEREYYRAKLKAARRVCSGQVKPSDLPSNREIRDQIELLARMYEGEKRKEKLREMRLEALRMMRLLEQFRPRLVGSTLTGHIRRGSDIDIHVFSDSVEAVCTALEAEGVRYEVERKQVRKEGEFRQYTHIHIRDRFDFELTVYPTTMINHVFRSSITGQPMERATIAQLEELLRREYPNICLEQEVLEAESKVDRFQVYESLLLPLEHVKQGQTFHPEGDVLYHSLQVFELARQHEPYDEEFLTAALLHDVGKGIDPRDHVRAGLEALEGFISERTAWFIEHHMEAQKINEGTLGQRRLRKLQESEDFELLRLLAECDRKGRAVGVPVPDVEEALEYLRELAQENGE